MIGRSLSLISLITLLLPLSASAQTVDSTDHLDKRVSELQKELKLTDDQADQLRQIFEEARPPQPSEGRVADKSDQKSGENPRGRRGEISEKIQSVLTEKQWDKYQEYERARRTASQLETLTEALNLTEKQAAQIESILDYFQGRTEEIFSEEYGDQQDMRKAMQKLREAQDREIEEVLTDEQKDLYESYKNERREQMRNRRPGGRGRPDSGF
ncbi:MAG: hypothetical protein ABIK83_11630 [Candidatus Zixiibacteriota bacterium]